ncbi:organic cation transporter protein [Nematostella vectensis]|uniref:organic cation transporter protein n=1 Tax=Nematostella vectensis TaxID=45351 RepID=UPI0020777F7F|nr:organic cation transporter protein [Nematostella vectensis]
MSETADSAPSNADELGDTKNAKMRRYDDIYDSHVRSFGPYQRVLYLIMKLLIIPISAQFTALVFCLGTPEFQCTTANVTCPPRKCCDNCTSYEFVGPFTTSVSEWNLICDRGYIGASLQAVFFAGMMIGSVISGMMADAWGRKPCIFACTTLMALTSAGSAYADCISLFALLRFLLGIGLTGVMLTSFVYSLELVGPKRRTLISALTGIFWAGGGLLNLLESYFIRDWRLLLFVYSIPAVLLLPLWRFIPESPRWLMLHGRLDGSLDVLAKFGGKKGQNVDTESLRGLLEQIKEDQLKMQMKEKRYGLLDLVRTAKLRKWSLIMGYQWFVVAFVNFGLYLYLSQLAGDIYVNYAVTRSIATIAIPLDYIFLAKFGRRSYHGVYAIIGGTSLLIILAVNEKYPMATTILTILSIIIGPNWGTVYLITAELYPTVLRNSALGTGSLIGRIGGTIAPYFTMIAQLPGLSMTFPVTVFGLSAIIAGAMTYLLPETLFFKMHQTIEQTEAAEDDYSVVCCGKPLTRHKQTKAQAVEFKDGVVLTNFETVQNKRDQATLENGL